MNEESGEVWLRRLLAQFILYAVVTASARSRCALIIGLTAGVLENTMGTSPATARRNSATTAPSPSNGAASSTAAASAARASELARDWGSEAMVLSGVGHINVASGHQRWEQGLASPYRLRPSIG